MNDTAGLDALARTSDTSTVATKNAFFSSTTIQRSFSAFMIIKRAFAPLSRPGALLLFAWMSLACAHWSEKDRLEELSKSIEEYNYAFRWHNFPEAAAYLPVDLRARFIATHEADEQGLQIESYQVLQVDIKDEESALAVVRLRFMLLPSVTMQSRDLVQHWQLVNDHWILETEENSIRPLETVKVISSGGSGA